MKKPFIYALGAATYIVLLVSIANLFSAYAPKEDTIMAPITMLSLFVFSAAIMGFLFLSEPLMLFLDNKKKEAIMFFGKTVGSFAIFVVIFLVLLLSKIL